MVVDPVCGRTLPVGDCGPPLTFRGRRWYFCRDGARGCRLAFKREPERWADAQPEAGVVIAPWVPPRTRSASPFHITTEPLRVWTGSLPAGDDGES